MAGFVCISLALSGCAQNSPSESNNGPLGSETQEARENELRLADLQPLGTVISPLTRERAVTVLVDLWINQLPDSIEIITRTPDGIYTSTLGKRLLKNRRIHTFEIESGNPIPGDLVFYHEVELLSGE